MDLPPSGWYPDPYGTPRLLRWWDGSGWTQHTHPDVTAGGNGNGGAPAATAVQGAVEAAAVAGTAVQAAVQATAVQRPVEATALQATALQATALQATALQAAAGQPSAEWLSKTKPPTGPPTQPQPALPVSPGAVPAYQAAGAYQPTTVQPGYPQPGMGWGPAGGGDGAGTQLLAPWQAPGMPGGLGGPPSPGGPVPGYGYGYQEAQRRRHRRLVIGLAAGAVVAIAAIAVIVSSLGGSPSVPAADQSPAASPAAPSTAAAAASVSASPSSSASASPSATAGGLVADSQSGLSYSQLASPWQATASCPLNEGVFPWTDGEQASAGQVNGNNGQVTWYGEACSGPLPQQYGYSGTADLQNAADSLASTFENAYYSDLNGSVTPGEDTPIQVSGHAGWEVTYDVSYPDAASQGATWNDERAAVVVIDNGTDQPAVFFTSIPSTLNEDNIATLVSSLQLSSSSAATSSQTADATPTDGSGDGGNDGSNP